VKKKIPWHGSFFWGASADAGFHREVDIGVNIISGQLNRSHPAGLPPTAARPRPILSHIAHKLSRRGTGNRERGIDRSHWILSRNMHPTTVARQAICGNKMKNLANITYCTTILILDYD
jgi:hypothetical protein